MSWDRELRVLNEAIRRCNAEYDAFLYGSVVKPPVESRRRVEEMFRQLAQSPSDAAADRYQLSTLQGRFYTLCERWERLQAEKEAGLRPGIHAGFATPGAELSAPSHPNAPAPGSVEADRGAGGSPDQELFERYVAARRELGEDVGGVRLETFLERLAEERHRLKARLGITQVEFDVVQKEGRVKLVAKPQASPKSKGQSPK